MLPKKYRLPLRTEWHKVREKGATLQSPLFGLVILRQAQDELESEGREGEEGSRFAFIVSKKISKKAVVRNRVRRLFSEAVRQLMPRIEPGFEGVFLAKRAILGKTLEEILKEAERVLDKVGALRVDVEE